MGQRLAFIGEEKHDLRLRVGGPVEDKVRKIAEIIGCDPDELLALGGRVASDLTEIIRQRPREMADFLRAAKGLSAEEMARLARQAQKAKGK
jgi:HTH-type transcriptional regulator, competence development regulator